MTPEQKQLIQQLQERRDKYNMLPVRREYPELPTWKEIDILLSLVAEQEAEPRKHGDGRYCAHHDDDPAHAKECYDAEDRPQMLSVPDGAGVYDEKGNYTLLAQNAIDRHVDLMRSACIKRIRGLRHNSEPDDSRWNAALYHAETQIKSLTLQEQETKQ